MPAPRHTESRRRISGAPIRSDAAPATPAQIIAQVRAAGGEFVVIDGRLILRRSRSVPAAIIDEIRARRDDILTAIAAPAEQLALLKPVDFWQRESDRFDNLLREFGLAGSAVRR